MLAMKKSLGDFVSAFVFRKLFVCFVATLIMASADRSALAQFDFQVAPSLQKFNAGPPPHNLAFKSRVRVQPNAKVGLVEITATMDPSWHLYSLTQPPGGSQKSAIKLDPSNQFRVLGTFAPDHPPKKHYSEIFQVTEEEFSGSVTWSAPIELLAPASALRVTGYLEGQICADGGSCDPFDESETRFEATVDGELSTEETTSLAGGRVDETHTALRTWLSHRQVQPGDTIQLYVGFTPDPEWHVYAYAEQRPDFQQPTLIHASLPRGWKSSAAKSAAEIISEKGVTDDEVIRYYEGPATIALPITIPRDAEAGDYPLSGNIAFQTCSSVNCDFPTAVSWQTTVSVGDATGNELGTVAIDATPVEYEEVAKLVANGGPVETSDGPSDHAQQSNTSVVAAEPNANAQTQPVELLAANPTSPVAAPSASAQATATSTDNANASSATDSSPVRSFSDIEFDTPTESSLPLYQVLFYAFVGGFILNFMPCVLPVIGLKILSFVSQAGSDRSKVFKLNLWYSLGMLAVFWVLAVLAAAPVLGLSENGFGWGEQFNYQGFAIPLVCVVFVMALSFLGIWEIPIPGFATSNTASELSQKEGLSGAFFKGVITTLLATPCSAPGLFVAYGFAVRSKSASMAFLIFTVMGLGMAVPYLIIGAFPSLIRFLPKPGAWMDTFKHILGFVLLGTVIFLLMNVTFANLLATVALLFGLWFACWWIGSVPESAPADQRWRARAIAVVIALLSAMISFGGQFDAFGMSFNSLSRSAEHKVSLMIEREVALAGNSRGSLATPVAHSENELPWEPFRPGYIEELVQDHTVLVDFTADW